MISLRRTITWPKRRWRAGGFGIHSPFAYSFVTEVLSRGGAAGHEKLLDGLTGKDLHFASLLLRCIEYLKPASIAIYSDADGRLRHIIGSAQPDITIVGNDSTAVPDMTVFGATGDSLPGDNGSPVCIIARIDKEPSRSLWKRLTATCTRGMDFSDRRTGIICRFSHLPRQSFKIVIK